MTANVTHPFPGLCISKDAHRIKSCDFCRLKNRKCDRTSNCERCRNKGIPCVYSNNSTSSKAFRTLKKQMKDQKKHVGAGMDSALFPNTSVTPQPRESQLPHGSSTETLPPYSCSPSAPFHKAGAPPSPHQAHPSSSLPYAASSPRYYAPFPGVPSPQQHLTPLPSATTPSQPLSAHPIQYQYNQSAPTPSASMNRHEGHGGWSQGQARQSSFQSDTSSHHSHMTQTSYASTPSPVSQWKQSPILTTSHLALVPTKSMRPASLMQQQQQQQYVPILLAEQPRADPLKTLAAACEKELTLPSFSSLIQSIQHHKVL